MKTLFIAPVGEISSLASLSLSVVAALEKSGLRVGFVKPVGTPTDRSQNLYKTHFNRTAPTPMSPQFIAQAIRNNSYADLLENVIDLVGQAAKDNDVVVVEGMIYSSQQPYSNDLNADIARTLCSGVIFAGNSLANSPEEVATYLDIYAHLYSETHTWLAGYIINHVDDLEKIATTAQYCQTEFCKTIECLGAVPENNDLTDESAIIEYIAEHLTIETLLKALEIPRVKRMPPSAFRYELIKEARLANRRIVLPEGEEPRTLQAAAICAERGIARCLLLGEEAKILAVAKTHNITLPRDENGQLQGIEIIDPTTVAEQYVAGFVERRKHRGATEESAREALNNSVVVGTMMLAEGDVDGLVSGAVHTTADTIRPALQLIGTDANSSIVSSIFFMLMKDQVHVYGDCAVNPEPSAEQLADIALQSAESARIFGIEPRVAMLSYSTGSSGAGEAVEKVAKATKIAQEKAPELLIDGPLQFDAASVPSVGKQKAPDSAVAGRATVFIFPDLNTGNITYKAVQRSANVVCIGPMLQGLAKPVNDLSRGALVDDIVYTIAITALQGNR